MAWFPGAIRKPITAKNRSRMKWYRRVNLHVAVSEAPSLHSFFNVKGRADSHFYVRKDGTVEQYVDTADQAYADLQGNDATISIETQGGLANAQGEPWTAAQVEALARIYAWAVNAHGIPLKIASDSIPVGTTSHGLSWHRLGIDGNFPAGLLSGRKSGGMKYSHARGKVCPGDAKIRQVPEVYARAQALLNPKTDPAPDPEENDAMPGFNDRFDLSDGASKRLNGLKDLSLGAALGYAAAGGYEMPALIRETEKQTDLLEQILAELKKG